MPPKVALILCVILVTILLRIESKQNSQASLALWVPTIWILISGSRPVGAWFKYGSISSGGSYESGSPLDRLVLSSLIALAIFVLIRRRIDWNQILKYNFWLIMLYLYLASSILWSDLPLVSLKRWIKIAGLIPVAMVILTERQPLNALASVFRRCAYVLVPFSLVLIKYFQHIGVQYNRFNGKLMWTGVAGQKNGLGMLCALSAFFLIWATYRNRKSGTLFKYRTQTFADIMIVGIALILLHGSGVSYSATSVAALTTGLFIMLMLYRNKNRARWISAHLKVIVIALPVCYLLFSNILLPPVLALVGRDATLTGRTDIWHMALDIASSNPILGTGYGAFWGLESDISSAYRVKQAHNGYIGAYVELGIVGIVGLFAFLMEFSEKVRRNIEHVFDWGVFGMCFLVMILLWNYSEDTFFKTSLLWSSMVFVSIVLSSFHKVENSQYEGKTIVMARREKGVISKVSLP